MKSDQIKIQVIQKVRLAIAPHVGQVRARYSVDVTADSMTAMVTMTLKVLAGATRYDDAGRKKAGGALAALAGHVLLEELAASGQRDDRGPDLQILERAIALIANRHAGGPWPQPEAGENPDIMRLGLALASRLDQSIAEVLFLWAGGRCAASLGPELAGALSFERLVWLFGAKPVLTREEMGDARRAEVKQWKKRIVNEGYPVTLEALYEKSGIRSSTFSDRFYGSDQSLEPWDDDHPQVSKLRDLMAKDAAFWAKGNPVGHFADTRNIRRK